MATKKKGSKPNATDRLQEYIDSIEKRVGHDRERLSGYLDKIISAVEEVQDPLTVVGSADAVAKIGEALTRQTHLTVEALKIIARRSSSSKKDDSSDAYDEIGLPFEDGDSVEKDGSN